MKYGVGDWPEVNGNHRVVLQVGAPSAAVRAHVLWRRRDLEPESKAVWVIPAAQNERITNVSCPSITSESGDIVFEPTAGPGTYYGYYKPYTSEGSANNPSIVYQAPQDTAAPEWRARHGLDQAGLASGKWRELPKAQVVEIQAINDFHRTDPMELPATKAEMTSFLESVQGLPFVLFPEDRRQPIRMLNAIPVDWVRRTADQRSSFQGDAQRGEYYTYQIGLFANTRDLENVQVAFSDLKSENGAMIAAAGMTCFNTGGTDSHGKPLQKRIDLSKDRVQPLWCGVQIPGNAHAGVYTGKVTVRAAKLPAQIVDLAIHVSAETVSQSGDDELWRQSRLRWLNATIGLDDEVLAPFDPVRVEGNTVNVLGRRLRFAASGLPESIVSTFSRSVDATEATPRELLAGPMRFVILRKGEANSMPQWIPGPVKLSHPGTGAAEWTVDSHSDGFELSCRAKMECDGYVNYWLTLRATEDLEADDIALEIPFCSDAAQYMGGMEGEIRRRTQQWDWKWDVERADNHFWVGDVNAGLQVKLKNITPDWAIYNLRETGPYRDWAGEGHGGCRMRSEGDEVNVRAFTGPMQIKAGRELHFNFGMLITPVRTLNKDHWDWRYFHKYAASVPVAKIAQTGAKIINVHHACDLNPYINYPFLTTDKLGQYIREAHAAGMKVKIYYTVRELSNHAAEFWALRSLGDEVFPHGPEGGKIADKKGSSWLQEHVVYDYEPAWYERLGNGHSDAAIVQKGLSRWHNYYLEGLNYLARNVGINGLYLDGIGYDREIMKRVRKTLQRANPASLIDFHSGNNYSFCKVSTTTQYMELFPYIDSLWFGEGYDYNESPDYWLFNISGIPYGMFGEMLAGGGNRWRGMLYGMTARQAWGGGPEVPALWEVWDDFGIAEAKMVGYWDPACPVQTDRDDILATAYVREGKMLVALASWAKQPVTCTLRINLDTIGLKPENASLHAPEIAKFQSSARFKLGDGIRVEPGRGQVLILQPQRTLT